MSEVQALRSLADAIARLETLESFTADASDCPQMDLAWFIGAGCDGYNQLRKAMSEVIRGNMWWELRLAALEKARVDVSEARAELAKYWGKP